MRLSVKPGLSRRWDAPGRPVDHDANRFCGDALGVVESRLAGGKGQPNEGERR
jgi:hypothetical protein